VEDHQQIIDEIQLVDFGLSFSFDNPPGVEDLAIPCAYRAPETIFDAKVDQWSEIWALGCVLYELRNGQKLFESRSGRKDEILVQILKILGRLPKIWEKAWMEKLDKFARDKQATAGHLDGTGTTHMGADDGLARLNERQRKVEAFLGRSDMGEDPDETVQFGNLLNGIFRWIPEERLSLDYILDHPWCTTV
jgi:serine/threonine protein kinase